MAERGIRQVVVVENGQLCGVVNERDLFALQRVSMRQVNEGLHAADTVDKLQRAADDIRLLTQNLLAQGVGAEPVTRTIAALNDALSRRAIELVARAITTSPTSTGAGWRSAARAAASRRSPPTRTTRCCSRPADAVEAEARRARLMAFAREVNALSRHARLSAVHGQRDGRQPGVLPVDGGMEGRSSSAGSAQPTPAGAARRQHRVRLPAALRRPHALPTRCATGCSATRRPTRCSCA